MGNSTFELVPTAPFSFKETLWFLDRNLDDCMHEVRQGAVRKALRTKNGPSLIEIIGRENSIEVRLLSGAGHEEEVAAFVTEWFDLDRNIRPFYQLMKKDHEFAPLAAKYKGFRMVGIPDLFECLIWSIAGQQISLPFAYTLKRRFVEALGEKVRHEGQAYFLFPEPHQVTALQVSDLRQMQFTTRKAEYILGISKAFSDNEISKPILAAMAPEAQLKRLLGIRGIGPWSANYVLMKSLRAIDCVPYGDAGVNQALLKLKKFPKGTEAQVNHLLKDFKGWRTYLVYYLWRSLREMA